MSCECLREKENVRYFKVYSQFFLNYLIMYNWGTQLHLKKIFGDLETLKYVTLLARKISCEHVITVTSYKYKKLQVSYSCLN